MGKSAGLSITLDEAAQSRDAGRGRHRAGALTEEDSNLEMRKSSALFFFSSFPSIGVLFPSSGLPYRRELAGGGFFRLRMGIGGRNHQCSGGSAKHQPAEITE